VDFKAMNQSPDDLKSWMDARGLAAGDVALALGTEEQTVRKWRSQGVPPRRLPHVQRYMAEWIDPTTPAPPITEENIRALRERQNLILRPTSEQFSAWDRASRKDGAETLQQWAIRGLDALAEKPNMTLLDPPAPGKSSHISPA
jgi:hypothetical protein